MNSVPETGHKIFQSIKIDQSFPLFITFWCVLLGMIIYQIVEYCKKSDDKYLEENEGLPSFWEVLPKEKKRELIEEERVNRACLGLRTTSVDTLRKMKDSPTNPEKQIQNLAVYNMLHNR